MSGKMDNTEPPSPPTPNNRTRSAHSGPLVGTGHNTITLEKDLTPKIQRLDLQ